MHCPAKFLESAIQHTRHLTTAAPHSTMMGPAVRLLIMQYGINENSISPSGPKHNIIKEDVVGVIQKSSLKPIPMLIDTRGTREELSLKSVPKSVKAPGVQPKPGQTFVDIPLTNIRQVIAKRLSLSKNSTPHNYATTTIKLDCLNTLRKSLKAEGMNISVNDFIIKAVSIALRAVPQVNVQYIDDKIRMMESVDISVAVATPSGLITPIVFGADRLGLIAISDTVKSLAQKAKENKLQPQEFQGGTFTVSNLGMFGSIRKFTAIINPPQAAILAVGGTTAELDENGCAISKVSATLCYDNRAISEIDAQRFLQHVTVLLSDPEIMVTSTEGIADVSAFL
ncbi:hypothetical protein AB6A40_006226 [Gnathostoma spinigerum]|uniref:Peripheral subunit-binding (PSBD) domain-containing protein n=1 Tax=Gnathostoma spinigerum TaxID=75299 RepID=A0ABD6ES46_9BILA